MTKIEQKIDGNNNTTLAVGNINFNNISSTLAGVMPKISEIVRSEVEKPNDTKAYDIGEKITHNNIKAFKQIMDEYASFGTKIDELYNEYDNSNPGFKKSVLNYFRTKYLLRKTKLQMDNPNAELMDVIRANADTVIQDIYSEFKSALEKTNNLNIPMEDIETCSLAVTCHAFIECKILEKPVDDN